jgi:hypothetical protein
MQCISIVCFVEGGLLDDVKWCEDEIFLFLWSHNILDNTNEFGIEIMYDYYITMKSMFLVTKLFYHPSIVYASLTFLLS